jgi:dipeptidyl-peptidase-4
MSAMSESSAEQPSFPRLYARTLRFTLGVPRGLSVSPDGSRVLFLRSDSGTSRTTALWAFDVAEQRERLVADPAELLGGAGEQLSPQERSRRERAREAGAGIVSYASDSDNSLACFALSGQVWVLPIDGSGPARALPSSGAVIDPRLDPTGGLVAYASAGALRVVSVDASQDRPLAEPDGDEVTWGQAEFVAAEEMERYRGYWWAPDGRSLLVQRTDNSPVQVWHIADPANPAEPPVAHRYPAAGTANADVSLWHVGLDGSRTQVSWDVQAYEYLTRVSWTAHGAPVIQVMSRDQRRAQVLAVDVDSGATTLLREQSDEVWVDLVPGVPTLAEGGRLVTAEPSADTHRVVIDGEPLTPVGLQVAAVLGTDADGVLVAVTDEPVEMHLAHVAWDGTLSRLSEGGAVCTGAAAGGTTVISRSTLDTPGPTITVDFAGGSVQLSSNQHPPPLRPAVRLLRAGERELRTAVLFPSDHTPGATRLPVLMHPYAGPHALRVVSSSRAFLEPQWLADQGFCVVVADGRGTPSRGPAWERTVRDDLAAMTLQDQVDALAAVAQAYPDDVDTSRVAVSGWSYGGYLAALAVMARPDVFHAAVAGAPVTEWDLYDTFYTERYVGHPAEQPEVYERHSLSRIADQLAHPLMIIHGMADDNVVVAHTLRLSSALLAAGKSHEVLPLSGVTHMASQEVVAENLALVQVDFLRRALA